ncbi:hypothetical protein [Paenibacillus lautus]|uniref:hypothetical protein n=1 Tax=Paenibacillus lautus TaxID=1401 RepID=UPI001C7D850E|nr:hypothetical protein [Paenibacillus lautus]MBX4152338.1 hypothetical protein [Paenibacillus lautus]
MNKVTVKEYRAANGGDYDFYKLSDGRVYWLWLKAPFRGGDAARVHVMSDDPTQEIGTVFMEKTNYGVIRMGFEGKGNVTEVPITINQEIRPSKRYFLDKIVRNLLIKE